jgi:peptide/nickel transport system permease protein
MEWQRPVKDLIWEALGLTVALAVFSLLISWVIAIPMGVYSATHQYSMPDYVMSIFSFLGVGVPAFMWALIIMYFAQTQLGLNVGGLFSEKYLSAPWSLDKVVDLFKHIWIPAVIVAIENTAGDLRTTRANLLDEVNKPYVELARAKGLSERKLIWKYPVRVALNPFFSTVGWSLANRISSITLMSVVLSLQTTGPMQLRALTSQDMYLAGSILVLLSALTVVGTLVSDILLAWVDPRIRLEG